MKHIPYRRTDITKEKVKIIIEKIIKNDNDINMAKLKEKLLQELKCSHIVLLRVFGTSSFMKILMQFNIDYKIIYIKRKKRNYIRKDITKEKITIAIQNIVKNDKNSEW